MLLQTRGVNQRAQSPHGAALFADYFSHVRLRDSNLDARGAVALNLAHVNCFRIIDKSFDDHFDGVTHCSKLDPFSRGTCAAHSSGADESAL